MLIRSLINDLIDVNRKIEMLCYRGQFNTEEIRKLFKTEESLRKQIDSILLKWEERK